ncbi:uncharacterized protein LOC116266268 [Nymphaea colorata]|nr:uncharacterized protein LOC116266268 [Nymphaea colorata]
MGYVNNGSEIMERSHKKTGKKKRSLSETDLVDTEKNVDNDLVNEAMNSYNMEEPTMEEKLANLDLRDGSKMIKPLDENNLEDRLPSADSVGVLLQQALNADDRALLLECLYTQDEKVIRKSIISLNPSHFFKLLSYIASVIQSRGAVVACTIPWLKNLILHHSSSLMSQNSSLRALNSISQLIESRTSNFESALKLSTCLDLLEISDDAVADISMTPAVVYEDKDDSDGELTDATETDEDGEESEEAFL